MSLSTHVAEHFCQSASSVEDGLESVECGDGHWPDGDPVFV